jgi:hypothetical protein
VSARGDISGQIRPVVFTIDPESDLWSTDLSLLYLPDAWLGRLQILQAQKNGREELPNSIELRSLNSVLRALFPQVYTTLPYVPAAPEMFRREQGGGGRRPWLLASSPIDRDSLWRIIRAWLMVTYQECPGFRAVYDNLDENELQWVTVNMGMAQGTSPNGTVNLHKDAYKVLPTLIAHRLAGIPPTMRSIDGPARPLEADLSEEDMCGLLIEVHHEPSYLLHVPSADGAELVSWPPSHYTTKKGQIPYSYVVRITAQTVAGHPEPRIHMHYGVRRWVYSLTDEKGILMMKTRNYSVFLRGVHPWGGQGSSNAFTVARMRPVWDAVGKRVPTWNDSVPDILSIAQAGFAEQFRLPRPEDLVAHPADWLRSAGVEGVQAAITYAVTPLYHDVKQGLSLDVHERLTKSIEEAMRSRLSLIPAVDRLETVRNAAKTKNPLAMRLREIDTLVGQEGYRLEALADSVGTAPTVEIYWQSPEVRDYLVAQVVRLLTWSEREKEQSGAGYEEQEEEGTDLVLSGPLPPLAQLGALLPGLDWSDLTPSSSSSDAEGASHGGADANGYYDNAYGDPELAMLAQELAGPSPDQKAAFQAAVPDLGARTSRVGKPKRSPDPAPDEVSESVEIDLNGKGTLRIVPLPIAEGGIASPLSNTSKHRRDRIQATNKRAGEIAAYLKEARPVEEGTPVLALVELPDYSKPAMRDLRPGDPKMAIRIGMMGAGRVTQFIAPRDRLMDYKKSLADLEQRAEMSVRDGLRQLGYMPSGISFQPENSDYALPADLVVAAVWMLRLTHKTAQYPVYMPVVVMMRTSDSKVWAWLPDGKSPSVRPYRQALLDMYDIKRESVSRKMAAQNLEALKKFVLDELLNLGDDVLILASAQNARFLWPALANGSVQFDHLHFDRNDTPQPVEKLQGRPRIVRLRTSERGETPEYYWDGCKPGGSRAGIWLVDEDSRQYFNIGNKPKIMQNSGSSKDDDPSEFYAIPSVLEVVPVALQPGDVSEAWVNAVHQWRKMGYLTYETTILPWPMVLAARMDGYAQAIGPRVLPSEWERVQDEEDEEDDAGQPGAQQLTMF